MHCNICHTKLGAPLYEASSDYALTSLCELLRPSADLAVPDLWALAGEALPDTHNYYDSNYRILLDHEDEDQIYLVEGERIVYRTEHQVNTLLSKLDLPCGIASLTTTVLRHRPPDGCWSGAQIYRFIFLMSATCMFAIGSSFCPRVAGQCTILLVAGSLQRDYLTFCP